MHIAKVVAPPSAQLGVCSNLRWFAGVYGNFDENRLVEPAPAPRT